VRSRSPAPGRIRRLAEELEELGLPLDGPDQWRSLLLAEIDYALHPRVHERRVPSYGSMVEPTVPTDEWIRSTDLGVTRRPVGRFPIQQARRFADGLSSWMSRSVQDGDASIVFDRPAGSERDLVVLTAATGAVMVQRHPSGVVRIVGPFGVARFDGIDWHLEPPLKGWIEGISACSDHDEQRVLTQLLEFAVHDLGARGIGALLVHRPDEEDEEDVPALEARLPLPPPLQIRRPADLAPLTHALTQLDGAAIFDRSGTLRQLGVRLVPSREAESEVLGLGGMRHTAGRRYSYDDPSSTVIVVSEDGPVTVLRKGELVGRTETDAAVTDGEFTVPKQSETES
jgi:hypothetical protein